MFSRMNIKFDTVVYLPKNDLNIYYTFLWTEFTNTPGVYSIIFTKGYQTFILNGNKKRRYV